MRDAKSRIKPQLQRVLPAEKLQQKPHASVLLLHLLPKAQKHAKRTISAKKSRSREQETHQSVKCGTLHLPLKAGECTRVFTIQVLLPFPASNLARGRHANTKRKLTSTLKKRKPESENQEQGLGAKTLRSGTELKRQGTSSSMLNQQLHPQPKKDTEVPAITSFTLHNPFTFSQYITNPIHSI